MPWERGFNFRATVPYVDDRPPETYVIGSQYPVTRNGVTFGWVGAANSNTRDRANTAGFDRRLAGINYASNGGSGLTFQVDLPGPGLYDLRAALGDPASNHSPQYLQVTDADSGAVVYTLNLTAGTTSVQSADAAGNVWADDSRSGFVKEWEGENVPVRMALGRAVRFRIGAPTGSDVTTLQHLSLKRVESSRTPTRAAIIASAGSGGGGGSASASAAVTLGPFVASASATPGTSASSAATMGSFVASSSATPGTTAAAAVTLGSFVASATAMTGTGVAVSAAATMGSFVVSAAAGPGAGVAASVTLGAFVAAATVADGTGLSASAAITLGPFVASASLQPGIFIVANAVMQSFTASATARPQGSISASAAVTLGSFVAAASLTPMAPGSAAASASVAMGSFVAVATLAPSGGGTPPNLDAAIALYIAGNVGGLTNCYLQEIPGRNADGSPVAYPYAILNYLNETPEWNTGGSDYAAWATYQVTVVSPTDTVSRSLRDLAYNLFTPAKSAGIASNATLTFGDGSLSPSAVVPGTKMQWKRTMKGPLGQGEWLYGFTVRFYVSRSM